MTSPGKRESLIFLCACAALRLLCAEAVAQHVVTTHERQYSGEITGISTNGVTLKMPQGTMVVPRSRIISVKMPAPAGVQRGLEAFEKGSLREAAFTLGKEIMKYQPLDSEDDWAQKGLLYYGRASLDQKDHENAKKAFSLFLQYYPVHPLEQDARIGMAEIEAGAGNYAAALELFKELTSEYENQIKPKGEGFRRAAKIYLGIGACLEGLDRKKEAVEAYLKVVAVYPREGVYEEALYNAGKLYMEMGQDRNAELRFSELIEHYPTSPFAREAIKARASLRLSDT